MYGLYSRAAYDGARTVFKNVLKVSNFKKALKWAKALKKVRKNFNLFCIPTFIQEEKFHL